MSADGYSDRPGPWDRVLGDEAAVDPRCLGHGYSLRARRVQGFAQVAKRSDRATNQGLVEAFRHGMDIHTATASKVYGVAPDMVTKEMRRHAKMVNFGIIYGISAFGLSERLGIPRKEAAEIINNYFEQYPGVKAYMDQSIQFAREHGYVETILGRRRYLPDINSANSVVRGYAERNAINAPIQGSSADMIKVAMINVFNEMRTHNMRSKMILQVHDELVFDAHRDEVEQLKQIVREKMTHAIELDIPLVVDMNTGKDWLEAH